MIDYVSQLIKNPKYSDIEYILATVEDCESWEGEAKIVIRDETIESFPVLAEVSLFSPSDRNPIASYFTRNKLNFSEISRRLGKVLIASDYGFELNQKNVDTLRPLMRSVLNFSLKHKVEALFLEIDHDLYDMFFNLGIPVEVVLPTPKDFISEKKQGRIPHMIAKLEITWSTLRLLEKDPEVDQSVNLNEIVSDLGKSF